MYLPTHVNVRKDKDRSPTLQSFIQLTSGKAFVHLVEIVYLPLHSIPYIEEAFTFFPFSSKPQNKGCLLKCWQATLKKSSLLQAKTQLKLTIDTFKNVFSSNDSKKRNVSLEDNFLVLAFCPLNLISGTVHLAVER